jgi:1-acyl-sn-glycerol-3-phosphate acyltransferase
MLLYRLLKYPTRLALTFFYKRIYILGTENLPRNKPIIAAANHANTFTDPITLASLQPYDLYFWARANEFSHPFLGWVARNVHMLPIHRIRDGKDGMAKNNATFDASKAILAQNNVLFIAPEGDCELEKHLRTLKQGTARLAFEYIKKYPDKDLYIVPSGLNYTTIPYAWGDFFMVFGQPIDVRRYTADYDHAPQAAIELLTADLRKSLLDVMLHIDTPENEPMVEGFWALYRNDYLDNAIPTFRYNPKRFLQEQRIAQKSQIDDEIEQFRPNIENYFRTLEELKIADFGVANAEKSHFSRWIFVVLAFPLQVAALFLCVPLVLLIKFLLARFVKDQTFRAPVAVVLGMVIFGFLSLLLTVVGLFFVDWYVAVAALPAILLIQYGSQHWQDQAQKLVQIAQFRHYRRLHPKRAETLLSERLLLRQRYEAWL